MALYGFRGLGWFLCCAIVAPGCYMVTSQVAGERAKLASVERAIIEARKEIRGFDTEFSTRANMMQLQQWNGEVLTMSAPTPDQYLSGEAALASLDATGAGAARPQLASLTVVPSGAPAVEAAVQAVDASASRPETQSPRQASAQAGAAAPAETRPAASRPGVARTAQATAPRGERVAMLDDRLLSSNTLSDIQHRAHSEKLAGR